jgi:uncharacterized protein (DUF362 family)
MLKLTRRELLINTARTALLAPLANFLSVPTQTVSAQTDYPQACAALGIDNDTPAAILKTALEGLGGLSRFIKPGQTVVIKPNATWAFPPHTASSSDPELLTALIEMVKLAGAARIIVMDHCAINPGTADCLRVSGIGQVVEQTGVEGIFPDRSMGAKELFTEIELPQGKAFKKVGVIKAAVEADVRINMGIAKTHSVTRMTMTLKHMMGFLQEPGQLHAKLSQGIADLNTESKLRPQLNILEAIRVRLPLENYRVCAGPETDKTHPDIVKRRNQIVAGIDPVLMDAYGCVEFYKVKPRELAHLKLAAEAGVGDMDIEKATTEGRFKTFKVGENTPLPTTEPTRPNITLTSTPISENKGAASTSFLATPSPLPTLPPQQAAPVQAQLSSAPSQCSNNVLNPNAFLSPALIPAAMVVAGTGLAIQRRMRAQQPSQPKESGNGDQNKPL